MKFVLKPGPVQLVEHPQFAPGFIYGLPCPACITKLQLAANIRSVLASSESRLHAYLGTPAAESSVGDCIFKFAANAIAFWYAEVQNRCGLIIEHHSCLTDLFLAKGGGASLTLVLPYRFAEASLAALALVLNLINDLSADIAQAADGESQIAALQKLIARYREKGQNVPDLLTAAISKRIPFHRIDGQIYQFGIGGAQRVIQSTFTENTSVIGARLVRNKITAAKILEQSGFPGGSPVQVHNADEAVEAAARLGYPVVVKPVDSDGGHGVSANLCNPEDVVCAFETACRVSPKIMVDRHIDGTGHRFTVIFGKVVKVTAKLPWGVKGDGVSTIAELAKVHLSTKVDTRLTIAAEPAFTGLDDEAISLLRQVSLTPDSVPDAGRFVALRRRNNANAGGSTELLNMDDVHRDNLALAVRIARLFMLDVAGIDLIIPDVSRSWLGQLCLVCDVNSQPQVGKTTAADYLESVMGGSGRIPVTLVLTSDTQASWLNDDFQALMKKLKIDGMSSSAGIWINGLQVGRPGMNGYSAAKALFLHRDVFNVAIFMSVTDINASGLPCDRFQKLVIWRSKSSNSEDAAWQVHVPGQITREAVELEIFECGQVLTRSQANSLLEKVWPHFVCNV